MCFSHHRRTGAVAAVRTRGRFAAFPPQPSDDESCVRKQFFCNRRRRGAAALEFALVAIPMFMFVFTSIEFGHAMLVMQSMEEAARTGCRTAVLHGATKESVEAEVDQMMRSSGIPNYSVSIEPATLSTLDQWKPITVTVTVNFAEVSWLPLPSHLSGLTFTANSTLPKEGAKST